jgi:hypothetical protein
MGNVLLGTVTLPLSTVLHGDATKADIRITRNQAPLGKGNSINVGTVGFTAVLEEARLQHQLHLREWSIALSNRVVSPDFSHPCSVSCTWPCFCASLPSCGGGTDDTLHEWGFGEFLDMHVATQDGKVMVGDTIVGRKALHFTSPLHSLGMTTAAQTPDHPATSMADALGTKHTDRDGVAQVDTLVRASRAINDSMSYAALHDESGGRECLTVNCSKSTVSGLGS